MFPNFFTCFHLLFLDQQYHLKPVEPHPQNLFVIPSPQPLNVFHSYNLLCHLHIMLKLVDLFQHSLFFIFKFVSIKNTNNTIFSSWFIFHISFIIKERKKTIVNCSIRQNECNHQLYSRCQAKDHQSCSHSLEITSEFFLDSEHNSAHHRHS